MIKQIKLNDIYHSLPSSWDELKYKHYKVIIQYQFEKEEEIEVDINEVLKATSDITPFATAIKANVNNTAAILSILTDIPMDTILNLQYHHYMLLAHKIGFVFTEITDIEKHKSGIEWKDFDSITANEYITFFQLAVDPVKNLGQFIKLFTVNNYSDEQIDELSAMDVQHGFFLLMIKYKKYISKQTKRQAWKVMKMAPKALINTLTKRKKQKS